MPALVAGTHAVVRNRFTALGDGAASSQKSPTVQAVLSS